MKAGVVSAGLSLVLLTAVATGCHSRNDVPSTAEECYDLGNATKGELSDIYAGVELIPLSFDGEDYPSDVNDMMVTGDNVFVWDNHSNLHVFNHDGSYVASSGKCKGMGPEEFSDMMGWTWNPYSEKIEILTPDALMLYERDFTFAGRGADMKGAEGMMFGQIFDLSATEHYLIPTEFDIHDNIWEYNSENGDVKSGTAFGDDIVTPISMQWQSFFRQSDGTLLFAPPAVTYSIYAVEGDDSGLVKKISFIPGDGWISREEISKNSDLEKMSRYLLTTTDLMPLRTMVTPDYVFLMAKGIEMNALHYFVADRRSGRIRSYRYSTGDSYLFPLIMYADADYAYAAMVKDDVESSPWLLMDIPDADSVMSTIEDESLILLKYRLKK